MKVYIAPKPSDSPFGIQRVVMAMYRYLPDFGVFPVEDAAEADLINCHAVTFVDVPDKPLVHSNHGLHWGELEWPVEYLQVNQYIIDIMCRAQAITCPSNWVNYALRRGLLRQPTTIYHGVNAEEWEPLPDGPGDYVLWNKARVDVVSDPADMNQVARLLPHIPFKSTLGIGTTNVETIGIQSHVDMKQTVQNAGILLATARETFGIGTLEALAAGVPVVGWDWGGQREIIRQGETGILAPYGDYKALAEAIAHVWGHRTEMGKNAREDALERWTWPARIEQYANLFQRVLAEWQAPRPDVSIIVTCHNLGRYLGGCLESVKQQEGVSFECLIVDDDSSDNTPEIARAFAEDDPRFVYLRTPQNLKLSGARNYGISHSKGKYLFPLDADDELLPQGLSTLVRFLDNAPDFHLAYGGLDVMNDAGEDRHKNDWPADHDFDWFGQLAHLNQMPYCTMMRREVALQSGGYRVRDWRAEDASFWCNVTSRGYRAARATKRSVVAYRFRPDSKSAQEGHNDGDWTAWYPWRLGAETPQEGYEMLRKGRKPKTSVVPFAAQGKADKGCWPVWSHHTPADDVVSVIIPVGPGHGKYVIDAIDSIMAQTFPFWEIVVVNDTGEPLDLSFAPFVRQVENGSHNIADSRNMGIAAARGTLLFFLDADDIATPTALEEMLAAYVEHDGSRYIYADWYNVAPNGEVNVKQSRDYVRDLRGMHPVSILVERAWCEAVGGFDPMLPGWEDWDFFVKLAIGGYCGQRLKRPLLVYRTFAGERREQSHRDGDLTLPILKERYEAYRSGEKQMAGCCGGGGEALLKIKQSIGLQVDDTPLPADKGAQLVRQQVRKPMRNDGKVVVEWLGKNQGAITIRSVSGQKLDEPYKGSAHVFHRSKLVSKHDAELLVNAGRCRYVVSQAIEEEIAFAAATPVPAVPEATTARALVENIAAAMPPEPEPEPDTRPIDEVVSRELLDYLAGRDVDDLHRLLEEEKAGKARKTFISRLEMVIEDAERI